MYLTRQITGAKRLKGLRLHSNGYEFGYKLGYCKCNEPILIKIQDINDVLERFKKTKEPRTPLAHVIIKALGGEIKK
jgi:hypothetical protein